MRTDKSRKRFVFLCVAPATILFFLFMILPTLNVFRMSLYERGAYSPNETFVGLKNFQHLLKDTQFTPPCARRSSTSSSTGRRPP